MMIFVLQIYGNKIEVKSSEPMHQVVTIMTDLVY